MTYELREVNASEAEVRLQRTTLLLPLSLMRELPEPTDDKISGSGHSNSVALPKFIHRGKGKNEDWTEQDNSRLFLWQKELGNSWCMIAKKLGKYRLLIVRNDNSVKNHFYSTFRRAVRHINKYIKENCRRPNIKPIGNRALLSILATAEEIRAEVRSISYELCVRCQAIKDKLIKHTVGVDTSDEEQLLQLIQEMLEASRFIKLNKQKKKKPNDPNIKRYPRIADKMQQPEPQLKAPEVIKPQAPPEVPTTLDNYEQHLGAPIPAYMPHLPYSANWMFQLQAIANGLYPPHWYYPQLSGWQ